MPALVLTIALTAAAAMPAPPIQVLVAVPIRPAPPMRRSLPSSPERRRQDLNADGQPISGRDRID